MEVTMHGAGHAENGDGFAENGDQQADPHGDQQADPHGDQRADPLTGPLNGPCRASEVLGRVGDKWSLQVIFCLGEGTRRFTDLKRSIDGISQRMLTVTLRGLERDGIVSRTMYAVMPPRVDYALTPMGDTLLEAASTLIRWAHAHLDEIEVARAAYDARERHSGRAFTA
jgi:DNA-binding HxlR family transcriptional regulator